MRFGRRCKGARRAKPWCSTLDKLLFRDGLLFSTGCLFRAVPLVFSILVAVQLLSEAPAFRKVSMSLGHLLLAFSVEPRLLTS